MKIRLRQETPICAMKTEIDGNIGKEALGYLLNTGFSLSNQKVVTDIQQRIGSLIPGPCWFLPGDSLHITLMDWIAPLVDYGTDKAQLYDRVKDLYIRELTEVLTGQKPILVNFDQIKVFPAAIIIEGQDDGSYSRIRRTYTDRCLLMEGTKPPPQIVHATIARFQEQVDLEPVHKSISNIGFEIEHTTSDFRLIQETQVPMLEYEVLQKFELGK